MNKFIYLTIILNDIELVVNKIGKLLIKKQHNYLIAFEKDKNQMPIQLYWQFIFTCLKKYVSFYAMLKISLQVNFFKEKKLKVEVFELYTRSITCFLRLLCIYTIKRQNLANKHLKLEDINQYWHFYKSCLIQSNSLKARYEDWPNNLL